MGIPIKRLLRNVNGENGGTMLDTARNLGGVFVGKHSLENTGLIDITTRQLSQEEGMNLDEVAEIRRMGNNPER